MLTCLIFSLSTISCWSFLVCLRSMSLKNSKSLSQSFASLSLSHRAEPNFTERKWFTRLKLGGWMELYELWYMSVYCVTVRIRVHCTQYKKYLLYFLYILMTVKQIIKKTSNLFYCWRHCNPLHYCQNPSFFCLDLSPVQN